MKLSLSRMNQETVNGRKVLQLEARNLLRLQKIYLVLEQRVGRKLRMEQVMNLENLQHLTTGILAEITFHCCAYNVHCSTAL